MKTLITLLTLLAATTTTLAHPTSANKHKGDNTGLDCEDGGVIGCCNINDASMISGMVMVPGKACDVVTSESPPVLSPHASQIHQISVTKHSRG